MVIDDDLEEQLLKTLPVKCSVILHKLENDHAADARVAICHGLTQNIHDRKHSSDSVINNTFAFICLLVSACCTAVLPNF
jgi:hypothetical protein